MARSDVLIIGSGPAGLAAAVELAKLGVERVTLVERDRALGGIPRQCHHTGFGLRDFRRIYRGPDYVQRYVGQLEKTATDIQIHTTVTGWQGPNAVQVTSPRGGDMLSASAVLLATGCRERPRAAQLVPGDRPPGVFTTGSLQRFVYEEGIAASSLGERAVIVGAELVSLSALMTLAHAGIRTVAMLTEHAAHQINWPFLPFKWWTINRQGVELVTRAKLMQIAGRRRVEAVEFLDTDTHTAHTRECDMVVFTGNWVPENELVRTGGIGLNIGSKGPMVDRGFHTSERGIFAAGNLLRGAEPADYAAQEGRRAAQGIAAFLENGNWPSERLSVITQDPVAWVTPTLLTFQQYKYAPKFIWRVSQVCPASTLRIKQGDRILQREIFPRLVPNISYSMDGKWLKQVDPHGPDIVWELGPGE